LENLDPLEAEVCLVRMDLLDQKDKMEIEVKLDQVDPRVNLETLVDPVHLVFKVLEDLLVEGVGEVPWVKMVNKVNLDRMARMERLVLKDYLDCQDLQVQVEIRVPWENKGPRETQDLLVCKVQEEILEKMVFLVNKEILVHLDLLVKEDHLEVLDQEVSKVCQDLQVKMGCQERMESKACRDHQE